VLAKKTTTPKRSFKSRALVGATLLAMTGGLATWAHAQTISNSRLTSVAGQPLAVTATIGSLSPEDSSSLKVKIADQDQWDKVGLKPPVRLDSLVVRLGPNSGINKRDIQITSSEPVSAAAVDFLLEVTTASSSQVIQLSFIVGGSVQAPTLPLSDQPATARNGTKITVVGSPGTANVKQGDTLFAIAQNNAVPGTTIYQMLLALFQANPNAFINQNMNLLKAGVTLEIPDADTVKAIDRQLARNTFAEQVQVFNAMRGRSNNVKPQKLTPTNSQSGSVQPVSPAPTAAKQGEDKVSLSTQSQADAAADARAVAEKQRQEEQARLDALQQNIKQLKEATAAAQPNSTAPEPVSAAPAAEANKPSDTAPKAAEAVVARDEKAKGGFDYQALSAWVLDNLLLVIAGALGLIAIVIAWAMRSAGMRDDYDVEDDEVSSEIDDAVATYFKNAQLHDHETADGHHHDAFVKAEAAETLNRIDLDLNTAADDDIVTLNTAADSSKPNPNK